MAVVRAAQIIDSNPYVHFESETGTLLLLSNDSNELYEVTVRECFRMDGDRRVHCKAYAQGQPCKHRALRHLLTRYTETLH